ncbi:MAG: molybdopterin molybdotransferase MoeA [Acidobacteriales bacterium]|nr:molybdopterin molybdotransferase MoeA [Terriglobales bacterium]
MTRPERILSYTEAMACVLDHARRIPAPGTEYMPIGNALGRVLAESLHADRPYPPFPRATRDGFAVCAADIRDVPARLKIIGQVKAGSHLPVEVHPGECVEIMTGAPVPLGADAIVMVEHTRAENGYAEIRRTQAAGDNIVPMGSESVADAVVLSCRERIGYRQVAVATTVGRSHVEVFRRPRVAILPTGDEVVEVDAPPGPSQIRNSNSYSLAAQVTDAGAEPMRLPIAPDDHGQLRELMSEGFAADLLLLSGGVSMGKFDLVEEILTDFGAEFHFTGAHIQPGKPVVFGCVNSMHVCHADRHPASADNKTHPHYFVGLPGNPLSTMVTFELFARPLIEGLSGAAPTSPRFAQARLRKEVKVRPGLTRFLPATLSGGPEQPEVERVAWQGSGDVFANARTDCYLVTPTDKDVLPSGSLVTVLLR